MPRPKSETAARRARALGVATAAVLATAVATAPGVATASQRVPFTVLPKAASYPEAAVVDRWSVAFLGFGAVHALSPDVLRLRSGPIATPKATHATLVTSVQSVSALSASLRVRTTAQRRRPTPNPWEVGWILWHVNADATRFYGLLLKPNGWELTKINPAYPDGGQRFLATGEHPRFPIGRWNAVHVRQRGATMSVWVDGRKIIDRLVDRRGPYRSGRLGLYVEDATARFADVRLRTPAPAPAPARGRAPAG